jgi:hypothetical protein
MSVYLFLMFVPCFACMMVDVSLSLLLDLRGSILRLPSLFSLSISSFINHNHLWLIVFSPWEQGTDCCPLPHKISMFFFFIELGTCAEDRIKAMPQNYLDRRLHACFLVLKNSTEEDPNLALD